MSKLVESLKKTNEIEAPQWSHFVKTGSHKHLPPMQNDWWYLRVASLLNKVNKFGPIGVNKLAKQYGGKKNRGLKPDRKVTASRKVIRVGLQQLQSAGFIRYVESPSNGQIITKEGKEFLKKNNG